MKNIKNRSKLFIVSIALLFVWCGQKKDIQPSFNGKISSVAGKAEIFNQRSCLWEEIKVFRVVDFGDSIRTEAESEVEICFSGDNTIKIGENTKISVAMVADSADPEPGTIEVYTVFGSVLSNIRKLTGNYKNYHIKTPTASAAIRGTFFFVFFDPVVHITHINVLAGKVWVRNPHVFMPVPVIILPGFFTRIALHAVPVVPKRLNYGQWKKMHRLLPPPLHKKYYKKFKIITPRGAAGFDKLYKKSGKGDLTHKKGPKIAGPKPIAQPLKLKPDMRKPQEKNLTKGQQKNSPTDKPKGEKASANKKGKGGKKK